MARSHIMSWMVETGATTAARIPDAWRHDGHSCTLVGSCHGSRSHLKFRRGAARSIADSMSGRHRWRTAARRPRWLLRPEKVIVPPEEFWRRLAGQAARALILT